MDYKLSQNEALNAHLLVESGMVFEQGTGLSSNVTTSVYALLSSTSNTHWTDPSTVTGGLRFVSGANYSTALFSVFPINYQLSHNIVFSDINQGELQSTGKVFDKCVELNLPVIPTDYTPATSNIVSDSVSWIGYSLEYITLAGINNNEGVCTTLYLVFHFMDSSSQPMVRIYNTKTAEWSSGIGGGYKTYYHIHNNYYYLSGGTYIYKTADHTYSRNHMFDIELPLAILLNINTNTCYTFHCSTAPKSGGGFSSYFNCNETATSRSQFILIDNSHPAGILSALESGDHLKLLFNTEFESGIFDLMNEYLSAHQDSSYTGGVNYVKR